MLHLQYMSQRVTLQAKGQPQHSLVLSVQAKQTAMEELTQGQATTLARNEQVIDRSAEEAEDLEEMLNESIADSLRGAKQKAAGGGNEKKKKRCRPSSSEPEECVGI